LEKISLQKLKWIRSLLIKKNREKEQFILVEGEKIVLELLSQSRFEVKLIIGSEKFLLKNKISADCYSAKKGELEKMSSLTNAPDAIAVLEKPEKETIKNNTRTLILDGIQDPGNFGTIIRTADWFGITQIVCSPSNVEQFNPKTIQASMGSVFRIAIHYVDLPQFLSNIKEPIHGALLEGKSIYETNTAEMKYLVLGNEGNGISNEVLACITHPILIPGKGKAESLNVGIACGIFLAEWNRAL
jgi:RNA methyltransferase, TrmH family